MKKQQETSLVNVGSRLHQQLDAMPPEKMREMIRAAARKKALTSAEQKPTAGGDAKTAPMTSPSRSTNT